jgi:serralysin
MCPVQVQGFATYQGPSLAFSAIADGLAIVEEGGYLRLIYASRQDSWISALTIAQSAGAPLQPGAPQIGQAAGSDMVIQDLGSASRVLVFSSYGDRLRQVPLSSTGQLGTGTTLEAENTPLYGAVAMEVIERGATDLVVVAQRNFAGLKIYETTLNGPLALVFTLMDGPKSYLGDVVDMTFVAIEGRQFLLSLSALENGISLLEIDENGHASFVDAMGAEDGLPIGGAAAMQSVAINGVQYVVVAGTTSSSLTVVRVNDMGVLFLQDHLVDDRSTRFSDVAALDMFTWSGRCFVVAAGSDSGLSIVEVLPDGTLSPMTTLVLETGQAIANVTGIETTVIGTTAQIFLTDARGDRIHHFTTTLQGIGGTVSGVATVTGGALDERLFGSGWADTISGGAGDDFLHDGGGNDLLIGGAGADVFVFGTDRSADRIADFEDGIDRIDVSIWGRIYSSYSLDITYSATGATIAFGKETVTITKSGGGALVLTDDDFLF